MNDSFIEESKKEYNNLPIVSQRDLILIIAGGVISTFIGIFISFNFYIGSFMIIANLLNTVTMGDTTGSISIYIAVLYLTTAEFNLLNETSRRELTFAWLNQSSGGRGIGVGENLENVYGSYICVLKIISDADPLETSYIEGSLEILQEAL